MEKSIGNMKERLEYQSVEEMIKSREKKRIEDRKKRIEDRKERIED